MIPEIVVFNSIDEAQKAIEDIGAYGYGVAHMSSKAVFRVVKIKDVRIPAANILKQEMLAKGGEAAVAGGVINCSIPLTDVLLMGTLQQYRNVIETLKLQPFALAELADSLEKLLWGAKNTKHPIFRARSYTLPLGEKTYIMGILNVTPDSFSDGGKYNSVETALEQAQRLIKEGADIIDVGGESTRPGSETVSAAEEWCRVQPILEALVKYIDVPISIDTYKAEVAENALEIGAHIVNDIWGFQKDPEMASVVARFDAGAVLMHNQEGTHYEDLMTDMLSFMQRSVNIALKAGINPACLMLDPGFGFGKTWIHNLDLMKNLHFMQQLGYPVLLGTSRKSTIGKVLDLPVGERIEGTAATVTMGITEGVDVVRVHDVKEMARVVKMTDAMVRR